MNVLIYGAGSVGLGLGSCLLKAGVEVVLIGRAGTVRALKQGGLVRGGIFGQFCVEAGTFDACELLDEIKKQTFDYILVCTKSFDSANAAKDLSEHPQVFGDETRIVLCQNGWGNAEKFVAHFPKERVYSARVITGFRRRKANEVEITVHADAIHIGSLFGCDADCVEPLAKVIGEGDIPCVSVTDIEKDLWAKMLYNCALNPLGAILDVPYGVLAENEFSKDLMDRIVEEVFAVMTGAGHQTHWSSAEGFLERFYAKLVPDTAEHRSSTLQDIKAGKRTEIGALTGAVLDLAEKQNINVSYNRAVYDIMKFLER